MTAAGHDVAHVRAANPGPFTLSGTNTWVVGRDPCWVVDPGPLLDEHVAAVAATAAERGGCGGIVLTHGHADHAEAVDALSAAVGAPLVPVADGERAGPLLALATPGHTPDHLAYVADGGPGGLGGPGPVAFTGDAVLGEGSVFVVGRLAAYLASLERLRDLGLDRIYPGHGPVVEDPTAKLGEYVAHRLDRERRLLDALAAGARTVDALLDAAWSDAPEILRPASAVTLGAHLDKLADEGRLPAGVERPEVPAWLGGT